MTKQERPIPSFTLSKIDKTIADYEKAMKELEPKLKASEPVYDPAQFELNEVARFTNWLFLNNKEKGNKISALKDIALNIMTKERGGKYFPGSDSFREQYEERGGSENMEPETTIYFRNVALSHVLLTDLDVLPEDIKKTMSRVKRIYYDIYNEPQLKRAYREKYPDNRNFNVDTGENN